jgi:hypothetical protein
VAFRFGGRPKLIAGLVAAVLALSTIAPGFAQSSPSSGGNTTPPGSNVAGTLPSGPTNTAGNSGGVTSSGGWIGSSDAQGANTYIGHVESPKAGQNVSAGSNLLVSGWAADTTAQGWAGFDQMQVYNGDKANGGTKVADGQVGLSRPDVAAFLGSNYKNSGFSAVVPAGALSGGPATLFVYLHTASKGWWYQSVAVNQAATVALEFPNDPLVDILLPCCNNEVTTKQFLDRLVVVGFALDRNPVTDPGNQSALFGPGAGPGEAGIGAVTLYLDAMPGMPGYNPATNLIAGAGLGIEPLANNHGPAAGPIHLASNFPDITRVYGPQYEWAGWVTTWDTRTAQPDMWHTLYAVARSSIQCTGSAPSTCKTNYASTQVYLKQSQSPGTAPACSVFDLAVKHRSCSILPGFD